MTTRKIKKNYNLRTSKPDTHLKAVTDLMYKYHLPRKKVMSIIMAFFGKYGLKHFIGQYQKINVNGLGTFYFHKSTLKKQQRIKRQINEYNMNFKQRLYFSKKVGVFTDETLKLKKKYQRRHQ